MNSEIILLISIALIIIGCFVFPLLKNKRKLPEDSIGENSANTQSSRGKKERFSSHFVKELVPEIDRLYLDLEVKGLDEYVFREYSPGSFVLGGVTPYKDMQLESSLNAIAKDMLSYLRLPPLVNVEVIRLTNEQTTTRAGEYQKIDFALKIIRIIVKPDYKMRNVLATLCHECTHYFMEVKGLNIKDQARNEIRTDLLANMLGFSKFLQDGYEKIVTEKRDGTLVQTHTTKIGYITADECRETDRYMGLIRKKIFAVQEDVQKLEEVRTRADESLVVARQLFDQLELIDVMRIDYSSLDSEKMKRIQTEYAEYERVKESNRLGKIEQSIQNAQAESELQAMSKELEELSTKFATWAIVFQGKDIKH